MKRQLKGNYAYAAKALAIILALFQIGTAAIAPLPDMQQRAIHVMLGFMLTFALISPRREIQNKIPLYDFVLIGITIAFSLNAYFKYIWFHTHIGWESPVDTTLGILATLVALEAARRVTGWAFVVLIGLAFAYAIFGSLIPGLYGHKGFSLIYLVQELYQTTSGIWGSIVGTSANVVAMFLIFGAVLAFAGGEVFISLAIWLMGRFRGGPAMTAVVGSAFFGTISGSALANVAAVGTFTIPLMKKLGYEPQFAAAVESCASSGGQLAPPIMGTAAFIMAEFLGVKYTDIAVAAIIPAILFYAALLFYVRFEALRLNLPSTPKDQIPPIKEFFSFKKLAPLVFPIAVLLFFIATGWSPGKACLYATVCSLVIYFFTDFKFSAIKKRFGIILTGLDLGGQAIVQVVSLLVAANIFVRLLTVTGVTVKFTEVIVSLAGTSALMALILTMVVVIILGMGLPTSAAYVLTIAVVGQGLIGLGFSPLSSHLFVFYFAIISLITPPVCPACFTAAAIAQTSWRKVSMISMRLAAVIYIVPFLWMYQPAILMEGDIGLIILTALRSLVGALCIATGLVGYFRSHLNHLTRLLAIGAGFMFLMPDIILSLYGVTAIAAALLFDFLLGRSKHVINKAQEGE